MSTQTTVEKLFPFLRVIGRTDGDTGTHYAVELDRDTGDFAHILNQECLIDGALRVVTGVERHTHMPPWHKGEVIGVFVPKPD